MKRTRLFWLVALLAVLALALSACAQGQQGAQPAPAQEEQPAEQAAEQPAQEAAEPPAAEEAAPAQEPGATVYKIGVVVAITGPGSGLGVPERNTAAMIAAQLEEQGGVTGPDGVVHPVEVIILDSESNPDTAAAAASRLINEEQVDVLVAGTLSGNSLAMVPLATEAGVPMISMASAQSIIVDPDTGETREWIFKTPQTNEHSARWQAEYLQNLGITQVCHLYENSGYGQDTLNQATQVFGEFGIEIVYSDTFERKDTEFPQVVSVQGAGCEAVVVGAIPPGASMVTAAIKDAMPDMLVIHGHGVCNKQFIDLAPDAVEGTVLPCGKLLVAEQLPEEDPQKPVLLQYIQDYTAFTDGEPVSTFGGHAWDAMMWSVEALASLEEGMDLAARRAAVRDYIENSIQDWPGISGIFTITPEDHLGLDYKALVMTRIQDGWYTYYGPELWE